ncbi:MAG: VWA domain-containing protein [Kiritimatiellae bacterium]|nr:VWA domain-containing protein [Kiritimatiellia bacterium]
MKRWSAIAVGALVTVLTVEASQVNLDLSLTNPVLLADKKQTTYIKVGLTGFEMSDEHSRAPANVAIVLDRSGSMQGDKIAKAREAALMVVDRLKSSDIVSIIAYDDKVNVLVPATKVSDKEQIRAGIRRIEAGGSTALFAGVSKGAAEVRKFLERRRFNRVILLSDGLANVGPDSPGELGALGASLVKESISVTTIGLGLGYNEDLMALLAERSDGNSYFAESSRDLARLFDAEFGDVLSVVAQEVLVTIKCGKGVRPVRVLGRDADISGQKVVASINQLYSKQEKYLILEVEVSATAEGRTRSIAEVSVSYANMETRTTDRLASSVSARFSESEEMVAENVSKDAMVAAVTQIATVKNELAVQLRDKGDVQEARQVLLSNAAFLEENAKQLDAPQLQEYSGANTEDAENLDEQSWARQRKSMRGFQFFNKQQQKVR